MLNIPNDPFLVEKLRKKLADGGEFRKFVKTYRGKYPEIEDLNTPKLWDKRNNRAHIERSDSPMTYHKIKIISEFIQNKSLHILNIGCGSGDMENRIFRLEGKNNLMWAGIDISPKSVVKCQKEFKNANFSMGDIRKLKFENAIFDMVVLMEILEHIRPRDTFKALKEVNRVLKVGGNLIVSVPLNEGLKEMVKKGENTNAHVRDYTLEILKSELLISGFEVVSFKVLYAFSSFYWIKTLLAKYILRNRWMPNSLVIFVRKK
jgi:SAM-dependent methyltransferase